MNDDLEEDEDDHLQEQDDHEVFTVDVDVEDVDEKQIQKQDDNEASILTILALSFNNCERLLSSLLNLLLIISCPYR